MKNQQSITMVGGKNVAPAPPAPKKSTKPTITEPKKITEPQKEPDNQ